MFVTDKAMEEMFPGFKYLKETQQEQMKIVALKNFTNPTTETKQAVELGKDMARLANARVVMNEPSSGFINKAMAFIDIVHVGFLKN